MTQLRATIRPRGQVGRPMPVPGNPHQPAHDAAPYKPEPSDDPAYDNATHVPPDPYAIAFAVKEAEEQMKKERTK